MNLWLIFLTGLTTGGLTCLAVQGGLLATAMTRQASATAPTSRRGRQAAPGVTIAQDPWPVAAFLAAKLLAYTVLGFLLGWLGAAVQITPTVQAIMQIIAGLFMLATALNMLNVHPIFRYAAIQPPRALTRLVRNQAQSEKVFAPALLGLMTVFIPCGTTQAMMVLAVSSASPLLGALILFAFVLGTSPTFFVLGFAMTRLRGRVQRAFTALTAVLVLALGFIAIDSGLKLAGSPLAPSAIAASLFRPDTAGGAVTETEGVQEVTINVTDRGYTPNVFTVRSGEPLRVRLVTDNTYGCARAFVIPALNVQRLLPPTGVEVLELPAMPPGRLDFTCSMGMYGGVITIVEG
jgi:sulfite exporter TauE/SafE